MEISIVILASLLLAHLIGDFILQTDEMAKQKSYDSIVLVEHVIVYSIPFIPIVLLTMNIGQMVVFLITNLTLHFATDYVTSRVAAAFWKRDSRHEFFVTIGIDQFIHIITIVLLFVHIKGLHYENYFS